MKIILVTLSKKAVTLEIDGEITYEPDESRQVPFEFVDLGEKQKKRSEQCQRKRQERRLKIVSQHH